MGEGAIAIDNLVYTGTDKGASVLSGETLEDVANINIIRNDIGSVLGDGKILLCPTYDPVLKWGI